MCMQITLRKNSILRRAMAAVCALGLSLAVSACGNSDNGAQSTSDSQVPPLTGVTATGTLGEKPEVKIDKDITITDNSASILQEGNGEELKSGYRVCLQYTQYNAKTGEEIASTWTNDVPDCSYVYQPDNTVSSITSATLAQVFNTVLKGQRLNTVVGYGSYDGNDDDQAYIMVATVISQSKDYTKAEGTKVTDIPADLPKVTTDADGKPSIDMNGYKGSDTLVSQTLIEGNGAEVTENTYGIVANYTGWLLDGTQFDSSWDRGTPAEFALSGVIKGWQEGLVGHTVGSQVLLVVPPDLGYGDQESGSIPANSTLVFVVDILAQY